MMNTITQKSYRVQAWMECLCQAGGIGGWNRNRRDEIEEEGR